MKLTPEEFAAKLETCVARVCFIKMDDTGRIMHATRNMDTIRECAAEFNELEAPKPGDESVVVFDTDLKQCRRIRLSAIVSIE